MCRAQFTWAPNAGLYTKRMERNFATNNTGSYITQWNGMYRSTYEMIPGQAREANEHPVKHTINWLYKFPATRGNPNLAIDHHYSKVSHAGITFPFAEYLASLIMPVYTTGTPKGWLLVRGHRCGNSLAFG